MANEYVADLTPRTVYDEVREYRVDVLTDFVTPAHWDVLSWRQKCLRIAALAIAQIEALDRRTAEGGK